MGSESHFIHLSAIYGMSNHLHSGTLWWERPCLTGRQNGGLYCDENGEIQKPFPDKPYCQDGTGAVVAINKAGGPVSFCQTVLPGNEAMLIPTLVEETATLAVPDPSYWCSTAAQ